MVSTVAVVRCSSNTHQWSPAYGLTCSDQPSGESHDSVPEPASPMARRVNAAPNTVNATPRATRALGDSCAATPATAVNTMPEPASAAPKANDPPRGMSVLSNPAAPIAPVAIEPPNDKISAAVRLA